MSEIKVEVKSKSPYTGVEYLADAAKLYAAIHRLQQQPLFYTRMIDTETTGSRVFLDRLKVVQIGVQGLPIYVIQIERIDERAWEPLRLYFSEPRPNVLQNAKFDLCMLAAAGLPLAGAIRDTFLRSKLFHLGNREASHSLKALAFEWCGEAIDKKEQKSFLHDHSREPLTQEQIDYAADDCFYTQAVDAQLAKGLIERENKRPGILMYVAREERFLPLLAGLEVRGFALNKAAVGLLTKQIKQEMEVLEQELEPFLSPSLKQIKLRFRHKPPFSPTKIPLQKLQDAFRIEDDSAETLLKASLKQPLVKSVLRHRALWRQLDCCKNLVAAVNAATGKLHADHNQIDKIQGTLSPSRTQIEPLEKLAQITRDKNLCLIAATPGYALLKVYFPDLELKLLAFYAQEQTLLAELNNDALPVRTLAQAIAEIKLETTYAKEALAKALWHGQGILNQRGAYLQRWLNSELGIVFDLSQIKALQALIPSKYTGLEPFHLAVGHWKYEERTTLLGASRLWRQSKPKEVRSFLIWSSFGEVVKESIRLASSLSAETHGRTLFINREHFFLETPLQHADSLQATLQKALAAKLEQTFPQITINVKTEIISNV